MKKHWRDRLKAAIQDSGKSYREISMLAGLGPSYVGEVVRTGKDPGTEKLLKLCDVLGVSVTYVLTGVEFSADDEALIRLVSEMSDEEKAHILGLLRVRRPS